jgi:hypothetical protein
MFRLLLSHLQALQDTDPIDKVFLMHCGIPNAYKYLFWQVEVYTILDSCSEHITYVLLYVIM